MSASVMLCRARLTLQSDWPTVLKQNEGCVWIIYKEIGQLSVEGEIRSAGVNGDGVPMVNASEGFSVTDISEKSIMISYPDKNITTKFTAPLCLFESIHNKSIESLDISPGGELGVSAGCDELLQIWQTDNGTVRRDLKGHAGDVSNCRFFPSGIVVLSGGLDTQLKIWSVQDGSCAQTLRGHEGGICGIVVVDKGRNIVSCSRDGSARLWDCGQGKCIDIVYKGNSSPINGCAVGAPDNYIELGSSDKSTGEREVGTEGKLLLLAIEDGTFKGIGLHSRKELFKVQACSAFNCCAFLSSEKVLGGNEDGSVYVVDLKNPSDPSIIQDSASPILCLKAFKEGFLVGRADGSCCYYNLNSHCTQEFTGPDCDPIYDLGCHGNILFTACRDHIIRKYRI